MAWAKQIDKQIYLEYKQKEMQRKKVQRLEGTFRNLALYTIGNKAIWPLFEPNVKVTMAFYNCNYNVTMATITRDTIASGN